MLYLNFENIENIIRNSPLGFVRICFYQYFDASFYFLSLKLGSLKESETESQTGERRTRNKVEGRSRSPRQTFATSGSEGKYFPVLPCSKINPNSLSCKQAELTTCQTCSICTVSYTGIKSFSFLCGTQRILGQKVSTKS